MSRCAILALALCAAFSSNSAVAQREVVVERTIPAADQAEARALFHRAVEAFELGDFQSALDQFERSYELSQRPVLLFNIGSAADRLRNDERAISAFRAYLTLLPDAENAASVRSRLAHLEEASSTRIERVSADENIDHEPIERIDAIQPVERGETDGTTVMDEEMAEQGARRDRDLVLAPRRSAAPLALLIGGGALALTGGALFATGYVTARGVEDEDQPEWADVKDRVRRSSLFLNLGYVFTGVGAALLIGGAIWWSVDDAPVEVALSANGLSVRGEF